MGEYVKDMRKLIGHRPLMICGASVIVENEKGEVLLQKREDDGTWAYAGGSIELYEEVEAAAARELLEETGLIADELELLGVFSGEQMHHIYPNQDEASIVDTVFVCRKYHGELICQPEEVLELQWFALNELPEPMMHTSLPALQKLQALRKGQNKNCE